jgi:hypothetical protein
MAQVEREQIINYLLQQCDAKDVIIVDLQKQIVELKKKYEPTV